MDKQLLLAWSKLYTLRLLFFTACVGPEREASGGLGGLNVFIRYHLFNRRENGNFFIFIPERQGVTY